MVDRRIQKHVNPDESENEERIEDSDDDDDDQEENIGAVTISGDDEEEMESDEEDDEESKDDESVQRVYLPNQTNSDEPLECDESAYIFYHKLKTGDPCLSFDIIEDNLGDNRADNFPLTMTLVSGSQAERTHANSLTIMKLSNIAPSKANVKGDKSDDEEEEERSDDEDEEQKPVLECAVVRHPGCVNRLKVTYLNGKPIVATWSELGNVILWDISLPVRAVNDRHVLTSYVRNNEAPKPLFTFSGHQVEGYGLSWSPLIPGMLATGDCKKNIHLWKPMEGGLWHVDQRAYKGHTASVEDIQWSPSEQNVMASCSVDKSIRIWDIRAPPDKACMLTKQDAHESDVNVIHWNKYDPLILSGGDDGQIKVWDLRTFPEKPAVCTFKHHVAPITSVEWHPTDRSAYAASGDDDQLTIWDLAVERDIDVESANNTSPEILSLPPQLLFIHQGQKEVKELHWHSQMPGVLLSTAASGFNVFRTISI